MKAWETSREMITIQLAAQSVGWLACKATACYTRIHKNSAWVDLTCLKYHLQFMFVLQIPPCPQNRVKRWKYLQNMLFSVLVIFLALLWSWFLHKAICHQSDRDRKALMLAIPTQLHVLTKSPNKKEDCFITWPLAAVYRLTLASSAPSQV